MNRVVHFEIHSTDPEKAAQFYGSVFGWDIKEWVVPGQSSTMVGENRYWLISTGKDSEPGINGGLLLRRGPPATDQQGVNAYVCTIGVSSVDDYLLKVHGAGGTTALPKMPIPGVGWLAYCKDLDGNIFGIMQDDTTAK
jgi:predicted enzyme related to lactoylglutathione lyase